MPQWETRKRRWKRKPYRPRYNQSHCAKRRALAPGAEAGLYNCARCGERIEPGQAWDLGHVDGDGLRYAGPEHRHSRDCPEGGNRATAAIGSSARCGLRRGVGGRASGDSRHEGSTLMWCRGRDTLVSGAVRGCSRRRVAFVLPALAVGRPSAALLRRVDRAFQAIASEASTFLDASDGRSAAIDIREEEGTPLVSGRSNDHFEKGVTEGPNCCETSLPLTSGGRLGAWSRTEGDRVLELPKRELGGRCHACRRKPADESDKQPGND